MTAFLSGGGGVVSVFTAKEVFSFAGSGSGNRLVNNGYIKLIVVAIVATILGYQVGYDIALNQNNCSDSRYYDFLNNKAIWIEDKDELIGLERVMWITRIRLIDEKNRKTFSECKASNPQIKRLQEENIKKAKVDFENLISGEKMSKGIDLTSADFDVLKKIEDIIDDFNKNCGD